MTGPVSRILAAMNCRRGSPPGTAARAVRTPAAAVSAAALLLGAAAPTWRPARLAVRAVAAFMAMAGPVLVVAAARGRAAATSGHPATGAPTRQPSVTLPAVTILIPARDEAPVIAQLVADLGRAITRADLESGMVEVIVIDDRSRDGTAEIAQAALSEAGFGTAGRVVRRSGGPDGKAAALAAVTVEPEPGRVLVVLDADARVGPGFVDRCRLAVLAPVSVEPGTGCCPSHRRTVAATARRRMLRPASARRFVRALATAQDDEQGIDDVVLRGRLALGGVSEFRGDGLVIRSDVLAALGGWSVGSLCEDLDLSSRLVVSGLGQVERPAGLEVWEQPVGNLAALVVQRLRWAEGSLRRDLGIVLPTLRHGGLPARRQVEIAAWAAPALVPWIVLGLASGLSGARFGHARRLVAELGVAYACTSATLAWATLGGEPRLRFRDRAARTAGAVAFGTLWLGVLPVAWVRVAVHQGPPRFARTSHAPGVGFSAPDAIFAASDATLSAPAPRPRRGT